MAHVFGVCQQDKQGLLTQLKLERDEMDLGKDEKPVVQQTQSQPKLTYRSPRLTAYGKLQTLVAAGSSGKSERGRPRTDRRA